MVGPTMNLISGTHHSCERREYAFMVLRVYTIISLENETINPFANISITDAFYFLFIYLFIYLFFVDALKLSFWSV